MLRSIQKLIGDKRKQLIFPIFLMSLDAIGYHCMPYQYNSPADYLPQRLFSLLFQRGRNVQRPTLGFGKPLPFSKPWLF